jgi:hypothetical protein
MNNNEFIQWLRDGYRPPTEIGDDEQGGFLVPTRLFVDKKGRLNQLFRWLGWRFRIQSIYLRGIKIINPQEELLKSIKRKEHE